MKLSIVYLDTQFYRLDAYDIQVIEDICWIRWIIDFNSRVIIEINIFTSGAATSENIYFL